jgi:DNA (cytosine-5)-methyltransferase 1
VTPTSTRPILLDLFCGAGGAAVGYNRAGFDVIGVDVEQQDNFPFEFVRCDAIRVLSLLADGVEPWPGAPWFDAVHTSPPCQDHSELNVAAIDHDTSWMLPAARFYLRRQDRPWVIENVDGSGLPEQDDLFGAKGMLLCGTMFGLRLYRHRLFEASFPLGAPAHPRHDVPASKAGHWVPGTYVSVAGHCAPIAEAREAMGIDWTTRDELAEAIPPAFTQHIGAQLLKHLRERAA